MPPPAAAQRADGTLDPTFSGDRYDLFQTSISANFVRSGCIAVSASGELQIAAMATMRPRG